jgi:hypothetical protein
MELLDKYLQAVKFWLPGFQQADIIAELRDDIRSEAEEREGVLGRTLTEDEWESLLKQRGRPMLVAEKYLPQRSLIGPVLFPAYWFVLRLALLCYFLPWIGVWIGLVMFSPAYRVQHLGWAAAGDAYFLLSHALAAAAIVTLVFVILDRIKDKSWLTNDWSPRKLPRVRNTQKISRTGSAFELIANVIFGIWWLKILWTLTIFEASGMKVVLPSDWHKFFWPFLLLVVGNIPLRVWNFVRPYWTRERRMARAVSNLATCIVLFFVVKDFAPVLAQGPAIAAGKVASLSWIITFGLSLAFAIAGATCLVLTFVETWRAFRTEATGPTLKHSVAV